MDMHFALLSNKKYYGKDRNKTSVLPQSEIREAFPIIVVYTPTRLKMICIIHCSVCIDLQ